MNKNTKWYQTMLKKYGNEKAIKVAMAQRGFMGGSAITDKPKGFAILSKKERKLNARNASLKRWDKELDRRY
jgi:2-methylcitrate dehydratase PrpD